MTLLIENAPPTIEVLRERSSDRFGPAAPRDIRKELGDYYWDWARQLDRHKAPVSITMPEKPEPTKAPGPGIKTK